MIKKLLCIKAVVCNQKDEAMKVQKLIESAHKWDLINLAQVKKLTLKYLNFRLSIIIGRIDEPGVCWVYENIWVVNGARTPAPDVHCTN